MFEYPKRSGTWYQGKHKPIVTEELFQKVQEQLHRDQIIRETHEFAFTKLFTCGLCGSGICAEEKFKPLKDGGTNRYVYYGCSRARDRNCKNKYIREEELIEQIIGILDKVDINELGMKMKLEEEIGRFNKLQSVIGGKAKISDEVVKETDIRKYAKHLLREGNPTEKRELLSNLKSRLIYKDKCITLAPDTQ